MAKNWGDSIESKDRYTQGHCERVAFFSCVLADSAGFNARSLFWFRIGALLHDIGKIIVPTDVLNKPGKLTDEEWAIIKRHPEAGLELVAGIDFPGDIRAIIRNHHERWDGSGYPDGLAERRFSRRADSLRGGCLRCADDDADRTAGLTPRAPLRSCRLAGQFEPAPPRDFPGWQNG